MALPHGIESRQELLDAQAHVWNHIFNYINSMSLKCAIQLGIPDIIHEHGKPITLSELANALPINKAKSHGLYRLMRILVQSKFFNKVKVKITSTLSEDEEEAYSLTGASRLLLRSEPLSIRPFALAMMDPIVADPWHSMSEWFQNETITPFVTKHGSTFWECAGADQRFKRLFNEAMASDAGLVTSTLATECRHVFEGLKSMVDVGGGTGATARGLAAAFPGLKCTVLDLPHVVGGLEGGENLRFVGGDMFQSIPQADAVFLKWILHDWSDEHCIDLLGKCREAIREGGKVMIVDIVVGDQKQNESATQTQYCFDMLIMTVVAGKQRTEKEWAKLFSNAGFGNYKIHHVLGLRSLIENEELSTEQLLQAQAHVWNHMYAFINSASLKCAIQLGIPDIIHKHGKPMSLSQLVESIPADKAKSQSIHRLMRVLVQSKFFIQDGGSHDREEVRYWLTPASRLLLREAPLTVAPLALLALDPLLTNPWHHMSEWLANDRHLTQFEAANGLALWELAAHEPSLGSLFNEAMCSDSRLVARVLVRDYKHVLDGIRLLVDVGGGRGTMAKAIVDALPGMKCIILDLPHVVAGLESTDNLRFVGGDMFETIPPADAILLKWIMHDWDDDSCLKILKRCKEAVARNGTGGKVMIIDMVVDVHKQVDEVVEDQLYFDMAMMSYFNAKERSEQEWAKLLSDAGFTSYKITPAFGVRSLIEVYP